MEKSKKNLIVICWATKGNQDLPFVYLGENVIAHLASLEENRKLAKLHFIPFLPSEFKKCNNVKFLELELIQEKTFRVFLEDDVDNMLIIINKGLKNDFIDLVKSDEEETNESDQDLYLISDDESNQNSIPYFVGYDKKTDMYYLKPLSEIRYPDLLNSKN